MASYIFTHIFSDPDAGLDEWIDVLQFRGSDMREVPGLLGWTLRFIMVRPVLVDPPKLSFWST